MIIGISAFGGYQTYQSYQFYHTAAENKTLYEAEVNLNHKIVGENLGLKTELTKTEEGRKSLEKLSNSLKNENTELDKRATVAEEQYNKAQNDLNAKLAELNKINKELNVKKQEIEKANRGIAKFAEVEVLISDFEVSNNEYIINIHKSIEQINNYMYTSIEDYWDNATLYLSEAQKQYAIMNDLSKKIKNIFDTIKSGKY